MIDQKDRSVQKEEVIVDLDKFAKSTTLHGAKHVTSGHEAHTGFKGSRKR